jgi:hypothetical protein
MTVPEPRRLAVATLFLLCGTALAQEPAVDTSPKSRAPAPSSAEPAVNTAPQAPAPIEPSAGTTIVGERESPIGLYIMPWRNSGAEQGIDRPARLLDVEPLPVDPATFKRQLDYYNALSAHRQATSGGR